MFAPPVDEGPVDEGPVDEGHVDEGPVDEGPVVLEVSSPPIINIAAEELEHTTHKPSKPMMATCDIFYYIYRFYFKIYSKCNDQFKLFSLNQSS
jgi:hypothetical protein